MTRAAPPAAVLVLALLLAGCASARPGAPGAPGAPAASTPPTGGAAGSGTGSGALEAGLRIAERHRVATIGERRFTHAELWAAVEPSLRSPAFRVEEVGRSMQGRPIRAVRFGRGPTSVLLWSQMHGDESTSTMALADIFRFLADAGGDAEGDALRERLAAGLTITFVPMLNPDGAELFQRENAAGIDVNRDGRRLSTPEARALKGLRDRLEPDFGFNLHDQSARTRAGRTGPQTAIALLAPAFDSTRGYDEVRTRARLVAATLARTLAPALEGRLAKYDDGFNPRAFGDLMQRWGTSTVLIESGALPGDPQKQRLRALHVAGILAALDAIATGSYARADTAAYEGLPFNADGARDLIVAGGRLVLPGQPPMPADLAINFDDAVAKTGGRLREVGDLQGATAVDTLDATGLFLHPDSSALTSERGGVWLRIDAPALFDLRRGPEATSELVRRIGEQGPSAERAAGR
jgi:hypothetical protein